MEELAGLLSRERALLELLLFKIVSLRQLLVAGEVRFLPWASEEVDRATEKVREAELRRNSCLDQLSAELETSRGSRVTLRVLSETAPQPWRTIFAEHRRAYLKLATDLDVATAGARRLAETGGAAVTATLDRLSGSEPNRGRPASSSATYGPAARWEPVATGPRFSQAL